MDSRGSVGLLGLVIGLASPAVTTRDGLSFLPAASLTAVGPVVAQNGTPPTPRPAEIPFSQLKPDATLALELEPGAAVSADAIWVPQRDAGAIVRIDPKTNRADKPLSIGQPLCASLAVAFDTVWVPSCDRGTVARVDPKSGNVSASLPLPIAQPSGSIAVTAGSLWVVTDAKGVVSRIDPATNAPVAEAYVAAKPFGVAAADDAVWVTSEEGSLLTRINAHTNVMLETVKVGPRPGRVAIGAGAVWTLNRGDGSVSRVDSKTNNVVATIAIGESVANGDLAVGEGSVWVSAPGVPIARIDPRSNRVVQRFVGPGGGAILVGHGSLWVAAGPTLTWRLDPKLVAAMRP